MVNVVEQSSGTVSLSPQIHGLFQAGSRSESRLWVLGSLGGSPLSSRLASSEDAPLSGVPTDILVALALTMLRLWSRAIVAQAKVALHARWHRLSGQFLAFRDYRG